ncbi:hypothetical protein LCGC14_0423010 [marine sediment metagenome]|uniref:PD-(D/E)XK endonuclease-like domain-containing protein n=1 Tax=marine sediment metagenome TaxID=412755 RepID=A0A0F9VZL8_9ZZZZ
MIRLSASAIDNWKSCPTRWLNSNIHRVRKVEETDSRRTGTSWHKVHELNRDMDEITEYINEQYTTVPPYKTAEEWEIERVILLYCFSGYNWYYDQQPDQYTIVAIEIEFEMPLYDADGNEIKGVTVVGKIDQIVQDEYGNLYVREFKSTSLTINDEYWDHLNLDPQVSIYVQAANWLRVNGMLGEYGIGNRTPMIRRVLYNVWHKPKIGPKFITQKASKELVETGVYCEQKFKIIDGLEIFINNVTAIIEPGKKEGTFAIYETPDMFGARLLQDVVERPEFYFQQKELCRTPEQMVKFQAELLNIYTMMKYQLKNELWYTNDKQCNARFRCEYKALCDNGVVVDPADPPDGYAVRKQLDNCEVCKGVKGGVRGNENIIDGVVMCDYCHAEQMNKEKK